jgi:hypothetical protein
MTETEIAIWDAITEIGCNIDESEIPAAIAALDPEARELLAEMAGTRSNANDMS